MEEHQKRVVEEKEELDSKLDKLSAFFSTPRFSVLGDEDQALMRRQFVAMEIYSETLGRRIANF